MLSQFVSRHSLLVAGAVLLSLPVLSHVGESIPSNNDIEAWLPGDSESRVQYDWFCRSFGGDEAILVVFKEPRPTQELVESLRSRFDMLPSVSSCWSSESLRDALRENLLNDDQIDSTVTGLLKSEDGLLTGLLLTLSEAGCADRQGVVADVHAQIAYCGLDDSAVAGSPVVVSRLDTLGNRQNNQVFFILTLIICGALLYRSFRCFRITAGIMVCTVFAIELTLCCITLLGFEMNFILSSLPVLVMVFTLAVSIHFVHYYRASLASPDPIRKAFRSAIWPCVLATLTTVIGLVSLGLSGIGPVPQFGYASAIGAVIATVVGLTLTPVVVSLAPVASLPSHRRKSRLPLMATSILNRPGRLLLPGLLSVSVATAGLFMLTPHIDPLSFLPSGDRVLDDALLVRDEITSPTSIEAIVDLRSDPRSFVDKLNTVREVQATFNQCEHVRHTLSLASFLPEKMPESSFDVLSLLSSGGAADVAESFVADEYGVWRISVRLHDDSPDAVRAALPVLQTMVQRSDVHFTGLAPLLEQAQRDIFLGFWYSFLSAFGLITVVMMLALRSWKAGLLAMVPNFTPVCLVFGLLGWLSIPLDIGAMMTASIALGLAVDGTFHFLFAFQRSWKRRPCRYRAVRFALFTTGEAILSSAVVSAIGMLALTLSNFVPTMRFGLLMSILLLTAVIGDLVLLPALLAFRARRLHFHPGTPRAAARRRRSLSNAA